MKTRAIGNNGEETMVLHLVERDENLEYEVELPSEHKDLRCSNCKDVFIHHTKVEVFDRREDAEMTSVTTVWTTGYPPCYGMLHEQKKPSSEVMNPSKRRSGIRVTFVCECCSAISVMTIAQHKGHTQLALLFEGKEPDEEALEDNGVSF
jgi:RNase P subunit RPR2